MNRYTSHISQVMPEVIRKLGLGQKYKESKITESWNDIVGNTIADKTKPVRINRGILIVEISDSVWLYQLDRFHKKDILKNIKDKLKDIYVRDIRFKIGNFGESALKK